LPQPKRVPRRRNLQRCPCPDCGHRAYRDKVLTRTLHDLGDLAANRPRDLVVTYSQHCCSRCGRYFNADLADLAPPNSHYTHRVIALAARLVV
jgi:transposase